MSVRKHFMLSRPAGRMLTSMKNLAFKTNNQDGIINKNLKSCLSGNYATKMYFNSKLKINKAKKKKKGFNYIFVFTGIEGIQDVINLNIYFF